MSANFILKRGNEQLAIANSHEPLIVTLLFKGWKNKEDFLFPGDYSLMECSFVGAKNNIESFCFSNPKTISAEDFEKVSKNAILFELKGGHWFVQDENERLLSKKLLEDGLAEVFGIEFYEMVQQDVINYEEQFVCHNRI